jgi:tRNA U34 5-methylaminomethyl-2-thiouridine-forming methyltransferase MnmC
VKITKEIIITADGSSTIFIPEWNEHYHSHHGAVQEAKHVFLKHGLEEKQSLDGIQLLEIGFGTGLNAFLTNLEAKTKVNYIGLEAFPLKEEVTQLLNYAKSTEEVEIFSGIQTAPWEIRTTISPKLQLTKLNTTLQNYQLPSETIDLIYFDAFGPRVQPELWTVALFKKLFEL